jgi:heme/copper-type cytochrome/quinol oxidase subunit 2
MTGITKANRHCEPRALCVAKQSLLLFLAVGTVSILLSPGSASACSVCAGDPASPMTAGMNSAIWALLAITGTVLSTFVGFFLFLWRRARSSRRTQIDTAWLDGLRGVKNV